MTLVRMRHYFILLIILCSANVPAQTLNAHRSILGFETGATITAGVYKSYLNLFIQFSHKSSTKIYRPELERHVYGILLSRLYKPKYIVAQATAYPLALLSSDMETYHPKHYRQFEFMEINLLRTISSGYEEPYALSLLLGNFALFGYHEQDEQGKSRIRQSGSALAGIIITTGHLYIHDNIRVNERWWQYELILTGKLNEPKVRMIEWNFRIGTKHHQTDLTPDVALLILHRSHTEWNFRQFSFIRNSHFHYEAYFPIFHDGQKLPFTVRQYFSYGKKFPFKKFNRLFALRIGGGIIWEKLRLYNHDQRFFEAQQSSQITYLIQPSIEF